MSGILGLLFESGDSSNVCAVELYATFGAVRKHSVDFEALDAPRWIVESFTNSVQCPFDGPAVFLWIVFHGGCVHVRSQRSLISARNIRHSSTTPHLASS